MVSRLLGLIEQILRYGSIPADESLAQKQLLLSNLVLKHQNRLIVRNPIYEKIFNLDWIYQQARSNAIKAEKNKLMANTISAESLFNS